MNAARTVVLDLSALPEPPEVIIGHLRGENCGSHKHGAPPCPWATAIAKQIEAQTRPPKAAEPTNLGAVVSASQVGEVEGSERAWTRYNSSREGWIDSLGHAERSWDDLENVTVLSEGWSS